MSADIPLRHRLHQGALLPGKRQGHPKPAGLRVRAQPLGDGSRRANGTEARCVLEHVDSGQQRDFAGIAAGR